MQPAMCASMACNNLCHSEIVWILFQQTVTIPVRPVAGMLPPHVPAALMVFGITAEPVQVSRLYSIYRYLYLR